MRLIRVLAVLVFLIIAVVIVAQLFTSTPRRRVAPTPIVVPTLQPFTPSFIKAQPTATPESIIVTGVGQDVKPITLGAGIYIVSVNAQSQQPGHFSVHFLDATGAPSGGGLIVNEVLRSGSFNGRGTLTVGSGRTQNKPGRQLIEIDAEPTTRWAIFIST